jgi:transposase
MNEGTRSAVVKSSAAVVTIWEALVLSSQPWEVPDGLWVRLEPLMPKKPRRFRYPGRRPLDDRRVLSGILFVLCTGVGRERLPKELGCGSGMTCWRRLREWQEAGVWQRLDALLLAELLP